mmetsp:Transcript_36646/g.56091  ORF Transcript_36646/g.56091 Transcript_36646/m.56091 type:complete len:352 (+) Transcript_36646:233-1288(+)
MKLMKICGVHDFGWRDLHAPSGKRFKRQLSGAINLMKFLEDRRQLYEELCERREELFAALEEINKENDMLNNQLQDAKADTDQRCKELEEVENDCEEIGGEIAQQNKLQISIRTESTELKKKAKELKDNIATTSYALQEADAELRKLSTQVVQSPERIIVEVSSIKKTLENEKAECRKAEEEAQSCKAKIANVAKTETDIVNVIQIMDEAKDRKVMYEQVLEEIEASEENIALNQKKIAEVKETIEYYDDQLRCMEEKNSSEREKAQLDMDDAQHALEVSQREYLIVEQDRQEGMARIEAGEADVRALEKKIEEESIKTDAEIAGMISTFKEFEAVVLKKNEELMKAVAVN